MLRPLLISICLICSASSDPVDHIPNEISIEVRGDYRYIESNGIPEHSTGQFPNRGNPNKIEPQKHNYRVTLKPKANKSPTLIVRSSFGVAVNGVIFESSTAEYWRRDRNSGWRMEAIGPKGPTLGLDMNNAHVQRGGLYHYHAVPIGLMVELQGDVSESPKNPVMIGWAADGYPIYGPLGYSDTNDSESALKRLRPSWQLKKGTRQTEPEGPGGCYDGTYEQDYEFVEGSGDLDRFNGRSGVTPEHPEGTYYYVITTSFPFISRSWKGTPDPSFRKDEHRRGTRGPRPRPIGGGP
jgi:hypothetical protein